MPHSASAPLPDELLPRIGRWALVALILNSVIGAGIFGLPSSIAKLVGAAAPWAYALGGLASLVIVAIVVELASQFDKAGGAYLYVRTAFGPLLGTQCGWFSWLARVTTAAAIANLLTASLVSFWPALETAPLKAVLICGMFTLLAAVNVLGVLAGAWVSNVVTAAKLLPLFILIGAGLLKWSGTVATSSARPVGDLRAWMDVLIAMLFAYSGFESSVIPGSELKQPNRIVKQAAFSALAIVTLVYVALHMVVMRAVPEMATSERPLAEAATVYLGPTGGQMIALATIVSTFGWLSAAIITAPRLTYAMAQNGDLPRPLGWIHPKFSTPWVSIVFWAALVSGLAVYGNFAWNVVLSVAARLFVYSTMSAAAIKLRRSPIRRDTWRAPLGLAAPCLAIMLCLLLAIRLTAEHLILMGAVCALGLGTWYRCHRRKS